MDLHLLAPLVWMKESIGANYHQLGGMFPSPGTTLELPVGSVNSRLMQRDPGCAISIYPKRGK